MKPVLLALSLALTFSACARSEPVDSSPVVPGPSTDKPAPKGPRCPGCTEYTPPQTAADVPDMGPTDDGGTVPMDGGQECGGLDQPCCGDTLSCDEGLLCSSGDPRTCQPPPPCGGLGEACCSQDPSCSGDLICDDGTCKAPPPPACGSAGQACCDQGDKCGAGLVCFEDVCDPNGPSGACDGQGFGLTACTLTKGYYKTHACWPLSYLSLGSTVYSQAQLEVILADMGGGVIQLEQQLIAAKLNVADGAVAPAGLIEQADAAVDALVAGDVLDVLDLIAALDAFNQGQTTAPHCN